jgi:hypothetical protein
MTSTALTQVAPFTAGVGVRSSPMVVRVVDSASGLETHVTAWEELAAASLEANVFYEPWMLRPAIEAFGRGPLPLFVFVYRPPAEGSSEAPMLCGFFPVERHERYKGLPVPALALWWHIQCALCTPLVRAGYAREALAAFLEWARSDARGAPLVELGFVSADGPFHRVLVEELGARSMRSYVCDAFARALLVPCETSRDFLERAVSGQRRKELRRLRRRLGENGRLESRAWQSLDELDAWIDGYLQLEASGWKGREGTAIAQHPAQVAFIREVWRAAAARGRFQMLGLFLDGRPVAIGVNYLAGDVAFHFKIAYDEALARFSPGVQLELDLIEHAHAAPRLRWVDSCARANHPMIDRLWPDRRSIQWLLVSTQAPLGDLVVSALPVLRRLKRLCTGTKA